MRAPRSARPALVVGSGAMILAMDPATAKSLGLLVTFGGLQVIVTIMIVYIVIQIRGEREQNRDYIASLSRQASEDH